MTLLNKYSWEKEREGGNIVYYVLKDKHQVKARCSEKEYAIKISYLLNFLDCKAQEKIILSELVLMKKNKVTKETNGESKK
ncbi:MAG: hypothetical protein AABY07_00540 [Nanoarchaeota archaeon]